MFALFACAISACREAASGGAQGKALRTPSEDRADATPSPRAAEGDGGGIEPDPFEGTVEAGADARRVQIDAGPIRGRGSPGRIPPETIEAVVRASFGGMRKCYEQAVGTALQPRVVIRFVIDLDGHVTSARDGGSDLPDRKVVQCVADEFKKLRFPEPRGGTVTVVYPLLFSPGD